MDSADNIDPVENRASAQSPTTMTHGASGVPAHEPCNPRATARSPTTMTHGASGVPAHEPSETEEHSLPGLLPPTAESSNDDNDSETEVDATVTLPGPGHFPILT